MISLSAIAERRAAEQCAEARFTREPPRIRLVDADPRQQCACGRCAKCHKRQAMRDYRAAQKAGSVGHKRPGPKMDETRACTGCEGPIAQTNRSGLCKQCRESHVYDYPQAAAPHQFWRNGGGI